jgi:hypothetical protein
MNLSLTEALAQRASIKLYGRALTGFDLSGDMPRGIMIVAPALAEIRAFALGEHCVRLPLPTILLVPGTGYVDASDPCARAGDTIWCVGHGEQTLRVDFGQASYMDLLDEVQTRGISGGVTLENPRIQNGQVCGTVRIWARIEIFGAKVSVDERIPVCLPLQGCIPVFEFGFGNVQACVGASGGGIQVCLKLCVGKWGLSKCWDECVTIPLPAAVPATSTSALPCPCQAA